MAYLSLYRKYRSQSFDELAGQEHVTRTLQNALRAGRVAHAYLFSGPRGTGKTSTARLLARALNCEQGPTATPCGECVSCREIRDGVSPTVIEIDAASSRGIDEIRDLRQRVMTVPSQPGARKVFIVDEVHMLTTEACNALLKTLEEPPAHVLFILATTDAQKLPATILSRCQRFEFRRGSVSLIGERLRAVAEAEGYRLEPEAARLLSRAAAGSWRDAISLLEQVLSFGGAEVTAAQAAEMLGAVGEEALLELANGLERADGRTVYPLLDRLINKGTEPRQLARDLGEHFRALLMADAGALPDDAYGEETHRYLVEQAGRFGARRLVAALEALALAEKEMRWSDTGRVVLEVALARLMLEPIASEASFVPQTRPTQPAAAAGAERPVAAPPPAHTPSSLPESAQADFAGTARHFNGGKTDGGRANGEATDGGSSLGRPDEAPTAVSETSEEFDPFEHEQLPPSITGGKPRAAAPRAPVPETLTPNTQHPTPDTDLALIQSRWHVVLEQLRRSRAMTTAALLVEAEPLRLEGSELVVGFRHGILREKWERGDDKQRLGAALQSVFGQTLSVRTEILSESGAEAPVGRPATTGDGGARPLNGRPTGGSAPPADGAEPTPATPAESEAPRPAARTTRGTNHPNALEGDALLHEVIATFEGQIIEPEDDSIR